MPTLRDIKARQKSQRDRRRLMPRLKRNLKAIADEIAALRGLLAVMRKER